MNPCKMHHTYKYTEDDDNDEEVMIRVRDIKVKPKHNELNVTKVSEVILKCLSACVCVGFVLQMCSSRKETESPICLQPLHQVSVHLLNNTS